MIELEAEVADPARYGWKAHYLSVLAHEGFVVPVARALAPDEDLDTASLDLELSYAVRSSGLGEDGHTNSYAGHFRTHLDVRGTDGLHAAVADVRESGTAEMDMGVVVQEMVRAPIASGVAFSCHPVTLDRDVAMISWVQGLGDGLVSGAVSGHDLQVRRSDDTVVSGDWPHGDELLLELTSTLRRLEARLRQPVDVEWCVDRSNTLVLLQVRPVVLAPSSVEDLDTDEAFGRLPRVVAAHHKLALRADALRLGVPMSRARAIVAADGGGMPGVPPFQVGEHSAGRSVVLLHPARIEGRVVREFTMDCATDVEFFVRGCQRYAIRQYPAPAGAAASIAHTLEIGLKHSVLACVIEQEVLHAYATGIIRRTADGFLIEAALGHFVPKGYVETSTFALSEDFEVTLRAEVPQSKAYHFLNGHVIVETPPYEQLALADDDLRRLVRAMRPILDRRPSVALEFGLLAYKRVELEPYMIDVADGDAGVAVVSTADVERGIVSAGVASGRVVDLRIAGATDDLNAHLHDTIRQADAVPEPAIYIARHASLDLLPIVRSAAPGSGFIFERASLLSHLAVVMREYRLAAVTQTPDHIDRLVEGADRLAIDTAADVMVSAEEGTQR